jgi:hypothetical protein
MSWICPHCGITATLQSSNYTRGSESVAVGTALDSEGIYLSWFAVKCPSSKCGKFIFDLKTEFGNLQKNEFGRLTGRVAVDKNNERLFGIGQVRIEPRVGAPLSTHVPVVVKNDYEEAYLIKDLSPKAAATLCRRALQAMIRDFHKIVKPTLHAELEAIEGLCEPDLYKAMMGLKGIGNIGAHPEKDINLIVDVEEGEVDVLLGLLRILDSEWYVAKAKRIASISAVTALAASKTAAKANTVPAPSTLLSAP